ncbi:MULTISPECIES: hypothetical protein [Paenibacillus]|uniref:hypothetical protein n=1 Tax=Paenibacillus TaxID=44249 RepID=UPI00142DB3D8|nr:MULTISPECIES: hypothetical protein [Paenibacillus]KAF6618278.1 hypothetical protein HFE00_09355 [Paenibacillus sp. EKM101P]KAF6624623.1 hypothetical protein HFE03_03515 [Paenibacillus sp. EKM102P]KAF6635598.1 hypothetical protein HFE01_01515 [Paenibacillus sp. EKM10P]KAF6648692.1 hypothetical protein HFE02_10035 [Paenibacillus sp. EKM11P]MDN4085949.1 hypothetical protein [Paenibacillus polymyxa]
MGAIEQMELYPSITEADKKAVRKLLGNYPKMRLTVESLGRKESLTAEERQVYQEWSKLITELDMAINLILDDEVKKIIEHRFIKGRKYKFTVIQFQNHGMSVNTIDRRIDEGVKSIAETLKLCGILGVSWG